MDALVFGQRLRHFRKRAGLTLAELGERVGRPAPFLSQVENGKREPKLSDISALSAALSTPVADLMSDALPSRRAELEVAFERAQQTYTYKSLGLEHLRAGAGLSDEALEHLVGMFEALSRTSSPAKATPSELRAANGEVTARLRSRDGYLEHVEQAARQVLSACDYQGTGPLTSRHITDITTALGFRVRLVDDLPQSARSVIDGRNRVIYTAQRNELRTRQARKAILQTLASVALGHPPPASTEEILTQRLETAYFAAAVVAPESAAAAFLREAASGRDLAIEDLREHFYMSYEMAAQRFTNLATRHLELPTHFIRNDASGRIWKAYQNDGAPLPTDPDGGSESQWLCRRWGALAAFSSADRFDIHYQFTDTQEGSFWCATHISPDLADHALTVGVRFEHARLFRGRRTSRQEASSCPEDGCCRQAPAELESKWAGAVTTHSRAQERLLGLLAPGISGPPGLGEAIEFAERHENDPSNLQATE